MTEPVQIALITATPPTLFVILAFIRLHAKITGIHRQFNSRMDDLIKAVGIAEHAKGKAEGIAEQKGKSSG
jgi:hypothetical protein